MAMAAALSILALTVGLSLTRPAVGRFRIQPASAAILGALLTIAVGLLPLPAVLATLAFLALPILTIVSLMVITLIAERAGFFRLLAWHIASAADGNGLKLFTYLFFAGTLTGTLFTNDAAVLIYTPMVYRLIEEVKDESWTAANKIPYYFAVLYVANLVGAFVISNPINIVVSSWFGIGFVEYALWMSLPAMVSMIVTYFGLLLFFRRSIPTSYRMPEHFKSKVENTGFMVASAGVLLLTLAGFFTEQLTGIPTGYVAAIGATALAIAYRIFARGPLVGVVKGVGWDAIIFVIGIFLVANGLRTAGFTETVGTLILHAVDQGGQIGNFATGALAAGLSAVMNNHPTAGIMALAIGDLPLTDLSAQILAFSALIGGDLGPKMLPIGSLAALLWFRILRSKGVEISYWQYIKLGVPVTLAAMILSLLALNLEFALFVALR